MRTVLLGNNRLGHKVGTFLSARGELAGVVVHPRERRRHADDLLALGAPAWEWPDGLDGVRHLEPECLLSVLFGYILDAKWLDVATWRALNLHPGLLPYNRGTAPNVWP